jgi:hypothetical protein
MEAPALCSPCEIPPGSWFCLKADCDSYLDIEVLVDQHAVMKLIEFVPLR